ncbi:MAG: hypothetical protein CMB52_05640 [Euryarchaeota archaeon]|nr:hypothetical protein [Euryarchaeota archaeon]MBJ84980.1 hypothetical protein [Euryarchaeota archaeon]|tara:strand:- start:209 stop:394 length:186 start_codon:yes stop_codon:yes gene_type:complete
MSRIGKIVSVTVLREEYPQMWSQKSITGLVIKEDREIILVTTGEETIEISKKQILEIVEES